MMAYKKNFVIAIKHNGKILREIDDVVKLPFGAEYSILLKNKDSRRAVATVEVDGKGVLENKSLILEPNTSLELTGFMRGMAVRNNFKFIKKTKQISDYRGDRIDDSLVRVEFWYERRQVELPRVTTPPQPPVSPWICDTWCAGAQTSNIGASLGTNTKFASGPVTTNSVYYTNSISNNTVKKSRTKQSDDGITVKGSETYQGFSYGHTEELETISEVITLKLRGINKRTKKAVSKAVGVRTKLTCYTCGSKSRSNAKYCRKCGTYLH